MVFDSDFLALLIPGKMLSEVEPTGSGTEKLVKAASSHAWIHVCIYVHIRVCICVRVYVGQYLYVSVTQCCVFPAVLTAEHDSVFWSQA